MEIIVTWHFIMMIVISIILIIRVFTGEKYGLDLFRLLCGVILVLIWIVYVGIFIR